MRSTGSCPTKSACPPRISWRRWDLTDVKFTAVAHLGGASPVAGLRTATMAVHLGVARAVVLFVARNGRSQTPVTQRASLVPRTPFRHDLEQPHGLSLRVQQYSPLCRRH